MDKYTLPTSVIINGKECKFKADYRDILKMFEAFNDPDLLDSEKLIVGLHLFYLTDDYKEDLDLAIKTMLSFVDMGESGTSQAKPSKPLYDWEKDFNIIIAPINRVMGKDVRGLEYLHWWTFLSAFMEIGECTFNTYVGIRDKMNRGKKLEKYEEKILKDHREDIILKPKVDSITQSILDDVMGV